MGAVYVKHYPDRIVIENPGAFPEGVNEKNIITHPSTPRNKLIAELSIPNLSKKTYFPIQVRKISDHALSIFPLDYISPAHLCLLLYYKIK